MAQERDGFTKSLQFWHVSQTLPCAPHRVPRAADGAPQATAIINALAAASRHALHFHNLFVIRLFMGVCSWNEGLGRRCVLRLTALVIGRQAVAKVLPCFLLDR
jgi:hypothetical protein